MQRARTRGQAPVGARGEARAAARAGAAGSAALVASLLLAFAPTRARAEPPGVMTTRHLSMGNASRASASGASAAMINPAAMGLTPTFTIQPAYQVRVEDRTHGVAVTAMDSLNNSRLAIGLTYAFMHGTPEVTYNDTNGLEETLRLRHVGHEAGLSIGVVAVPGWLLVGVRPKYQFTSLRFEDPTGATVDANETHSAFGLDASLQLLVAGWVSVAALGYNLTGTHPAAWTEDRALTLDPLPVDYSTLDPANVSRLSDYPRTFAHAIAVFPTRRPGFSINFDGTYDFTSYWNTDLDGDGEDDRWARLTLGGGAEYTIGPVPLRVGGYWDRRGPASDDDRGYITGGVGFVRGTPSAGGVGVDIGVGFSRQIAGPNPETFIGAHIGLLLNPRL